MLSCTPTRMRYGSARQVRGRRSTTPAWVGDTRSPSQPEAAPFRKNEVDVRGAPGPVAERFQLAAYATPFDVANRTSSRCKPADGERTVMATVISSPARTVVRRMSGAPGTRVRGMSDEAVLAALRTFAAEREWTPFHTPANLAKSISIEAAELLECFQWSEDGDPADVVPELADVLTYYLLLADRLGVDPDAIVLDKLEVTRRKYPVERSRGRAGKHDRLPG